MRNLPGFSARVLYASAALGAMWLLAACGGGGGDGPSLAPSLPVQAKWTYMVYIAADNNLSQAAIGDLNEMESVGSTANVNIVVQVEFSQNQSFGGNPFPDSSATRRGRIVRETTDAMSNSLTAMPSNVDMADPNTLRDFIQYAATNYPADHYALVLWSHGAGWKAQPVGSPIRGALQDATSDTFMSLADIATAIADAGVPLDIVNFDACLMAMYEVAYELRSAARYLVASEEVEPGDGDPYELILGDLTATPAMTAEQLATAIVNRYDESYETITRDVVTKSAYDLTQMTTLDAQLRDLADALRDNIATERVNIQTARDATLEFQVYSYRDLGEFLQRLENLTSNAALKTKIATVRATLLAGVVANQTGPSDDARIASATGMAIFLPKKNEVSPEELTAYATVAAGQGNNIGLSWGEFINVLITGDTGDLQQSGPGNFTFCIRWDDPSVDLDLYIYEPTQLYAPWMGTTTPNGFFTPDSLASGEAFECYTAAEMVQTGDYDVFVNYFSGAQSTVVTLYTDLESPGNLQPLAGAQATMDLSDPAPADTSPLTSYGPLTEQAQRWSNWYFPTRTTRSIAGDREQHTDAAIDLNVTNSSTRSQVIVSNEYRSAFAKRLLMSKRNLSNGDPSRPASPKPLTREGS